MAVYEVTYRDGRPAQTFRNVGGSQINTTSVVLGNADGKIITVIPLELLKSCECLEHDVAPSLIQEAPAAPGPVLAFTRENLPGARR